MIALALTVALAPVHVVVLTSVWALLLSAFHFCTAIYRCSRPPVCCSRRPALLTVLYHARGNPPVTVLGALAGQELGPAHCC